MPGVGEPIVTWLWGGYAVGNPTLNRFYSLHYLLPFVIAGVVVLHIWALHMVGQNNPTGVEPKSEKDTVAFTPYATVKDAFFIGVFCIFFAWFVFYIPNYLGHSDNYIPANPGQTPTHIVPEWYYLPFYAILRAIPSKLLGVIALASSIVILAFLPWLDTSRVRSANYRPLYRQFLLIFFAGRDRPWLSRLAGAGGRLRARGAHPHRLLFRVLPHHPAAARICSRRPSRCRIRFRNRCCAMVCQPAHRRRASGARSAEAGHEPQSHASLAASLSGASLSGIGRLRRARRPARRRGSIGRSAGPFGQYDPAQLQRGFKIYNEVCSTCHSLKLLSFRNLADAGGPGFTEAQAAAIAATFQVTDGPERPGPDVPAAGQDRRSFPAAVPERSGRRAPRSAAELPPDMSVLAKARSYECGFPCFIIDAFTMYQEDGPDYIHAILNGYTDRARRLHAAAGQPLQQIFPRPRHRHAAAAERRPSRIYRRHAARRVDQYGRDVAAFLMWAAEPKLDERKRLGFQVMIFLFVFSGLLYFTKKKVWHAVDCIPNSSSRGRRPNTDS